MDAAGDRTQLIRTATTALAEGDTATAVTIYRQLYEGAQSDDTLLPGLALGACLARRREWPDALELFAVLTERFPGSAMARAYLGATRLELADFATAREDLDAAVAIDPNDAVVYAKRAEYFVRVGLFRQAEADYQQALRLPMPDDATRNYCRSALLSVRAELKTAIERSAPSPRVALGKLGWKKKQAAIESPAALAGSGQ
jgi:tetratricopeptide (TPR) repeat protein